MAIPTKRKNYKSVMFSVKAIANVRSFNSSSIRAGFAKMQLLGSVGTVTARETKDGLPYISYSLAVNRYNPTEENKTSTDWYNISVFNERHVSFFNDYLKPGMQLFVECNVRQKQLVDENDNKRYVTNLTQVNFDVIKFARKDDDVTESE